MTPAARRDTREAVPAMAAYVVALFASIWMLRMLDAPPARMLVALLPLLPILFAARAMLRFLDALDEFQRRVPLEALVLAALSVSLGSFALGLLTVAGAIPLRADLALVLVLPAFGGLHGLFACVVRRRYR